MYFRASILPLLAQTVILYVVKTLIIRNIIAKSTNSLIYLHNHSMH